MRVGTNRSVIGKEGGEVGDEFFLGDFSIFVFVHYGHEILNVVDVDFLAVRIGVAQVPQKAGDLCELQVTVLVFVVKFEDEQGFT